MAPMPGKKQKRAEEQRTPMQVAIDSAKTSSYNLCTPMYEAQHIRLRNPVTGLDQLYSSSSSIFYEAFYELVELGLKDKLMSEIDFFAKNIDSKWSDVYTNLNYYIESKGEGKVNEN